MSAPTQFTASPPTTDHSLAPTEAFELLADTRRRYALRYLAQRGETVTLDELASQHVQWEREPTSPPSGNLHERITVDLVHAHLPKLAEADVLRYDPARQTVERRETAAALRPYLDLSADADLVDC